MVEPVGGPGPVDEMEAEIRRVSLLFADIQASTQLIQHLDPEAAANVLGPPIRAMIEEVERFEGLASDRGDGIMAIFGAPTASEDHAVRACLAALAIRDRLSSGASSVKIRVGIHFGEVVFRRGRIGRLRMQDVFGAAVHIAARLEQTAEPGTVCLSSAAYELAQGFVHATRLPPIAAKGIDEPIERMLLVAADQTANRWTVRAGRGLAGLTNRFEELDVLARALAAGDFEGLRLVQLSGPAGIGKSRIIHEFLSTPAARQCHVVKFVGDPHRQSTGYYPISSWMRALLDIRSSDSANEARSKLARMLGQFGTVNDEHRNRLERMLGVSGHGRADLIELDAMKPLEVAQQIAAIILKISGGRPIILACEDLDNFDPPSQQLVSALAEALGHVNTLLVTTSRPRVRLPSIKAASARSITLAPLLDADAAQLLTNLYPDIHPSSALTTTILQKAGGNPLFLEEVATLVVASDPRRKATRTAMPDPGFGIPDRVEALIADRLARLPKLQRRLVQTCAVIGIHVPLRLAAKLTGIAEADLYRRLAKLQSEQLLFETRKYPDPQFTFKHALTRDVAYNTILPSRRRDYHRKIVDILESEAAQTHDRHLDDLCMHAVQAQAWTKAVTYLRLAADLSVEKSSYELAELYLNHALEISRTLPDEEATLRSRIEILLDLRVLVSANGKYLEAKHILDLAEELVGQLGDLELQSRIMVLRVHVLNILGDGQAAVTLAERSRELGRSLRDPRIEQLATYFLGQAHFNLGNFTTAEHALTQNVELMDRGAVIGPTGTLGTLPVLTHATRAMVRTMTGDFGGAEQDVERAQQYAAQSRRPYDLSFAAFEDGFMYWHRRDGDAATAALRRSVMLNESREIAELPPLLRGAAAQDILLFERARASLPHTEAALGHALLLENDLDGAMPWLTRGRDNAQKSSRYMIQIWAATGLALAHYLGHRDEAAGEFAEEACELALRYEFNGFRVQALRVRGLVRAGGPRATASAAEDLEAALALASSLGMRAEIGHCHAAFVLAGLDETGGHREAARNLYGELGMTAWSHRILDVANLGRRVYC